MTEREPWFGALRRGIRVKRDRGRSWGFVSWLPLVIDFGYLRVNRHWWHNLHARFATVYRLHYGEWPSYWYWDRGLPEPCDGDRDCTARIHVHGCFADRGNCDTPGEHRAGNSQSRPAE